MYVLQTGRKEKSDALNTAIDKMTKKTRDLRRQLRKAVMDHVSDSFLETNVPLLVLIEAAKNGNEKEVKEYAQVFREHANKLIEVANLACSISNNEEGVKLVRMAASQLEALCPQVANLACSISNNEEGVKLVRMAASQLEALCPQVINAALALAAKPNSKVAQDNMDLFKEQWEKQVHVLTDAVDDITSIDDFLCVSENHILEDVNKCVIALQEKDVDGLDRTAGAIRGRAARVVHVVTSEMDNYEPGVYTEKVIEATKLLTNTVMPRFSEQVEAAVEALSGNPSQILDENEFIDASRLVYDGVRDIRKAVLMIRTPEELDDSDFETEDFDIRSRTSVQTEDDQLIAGQSARVDSAMSLIQAAKNLMNAVVQTVKASYVASTKYQKSVGMKSLNLPAVSWKMKAPEKKPLVKREKPDEKTTMVKRASQKKNVNVVQALSEFKAMDSI
ncbi:UNVERIFIED_CONTAM: hypothetical protein FKN15_015349 [Acipenser sinensis]